MKATLLIRRRAAQSASAFVEVVIWRVPSAVPPSGHAFKYRLAYVFEGGCVVRYDNERGKGDHRHVDGEESAYRFSTPERLMLDFERDVERWNREHGHS